MIIKLVILSCIVSSLLTTCQQAKLTTNNIVFNIDYEYLENCETGKGKCDPIIITRQTKQDSVFIIYPSGGTQTDVYLYSSKNKLELHDRKFTGEGKPILNLSALEDGEYSSGMISCALGGSFIIKLITKK